MAKRRKQKVRLDASTRALVGRLVEGYLLRHRWRVAAALGCMLVAALATGALAQLMDPIINRVFAAEDQAMLWPVAAAALFVFAAKGGATYGQAVLMTHVGLRLVADLQTALFRQIMRADLAFFGESAPGGLVARFINDVNLLRNAIASTLTGIGKDLLTALALVGVMFYQDWLLAMIAFLVFPAAVLPILRVGRRLRRVSSVTQQQIGLLSTVLDESFQGARTVKAYGMEAYEAGRATQRIEEVFRLGLKTTRMRNILSPIMELLGGMAAVAVILYGGNLVIAGNQDPGSFAAFLTALLLAYEPMKRLARLNSNLQEGLAAAERVFELMDRRPSIVDAPDARPLTLGGAAIRFEGVSFAYPSARVPALHEVELTIPAGRTAALVGASGAGKSTVLNLVPRFYDVDAGRVLIDGQDVRRVTLASLRANVALVSQEILLFDDTVRANIAYGRPDAPVEAIERAARLAEAHDFIAALPEGYDTPVGPRGGKLSGGQRQRIAIARALLKDAPILLLDEATSALDSETERLVQRALKHLMRGRTTLMIAHRLSSIAEADVIYVMERGRIVEQGRHGELLALGGAYARLHALQAADRPAPPDDAARAAAGGTRARA